MPGWRMILAFKAAASGALQGIEDSVRLLRRTTIPGNGAVRYVHHRVPVQSARTFVSGTEHLG